MNRPATSTLTAIRSVRPIIVMLTLALAACATPVQLEFDAEVRRLCAIDGGFRVYERVPLSEDQFDYAGRPRIPPQSKATSNDPYYYELEFLELARRGNARLNKTIHRVVRREDGKVLGIGIRYGRRGGDPPGPWHPSSFLCPEVSPNVPSLTGS